MKLFFSFVFALLAFTACTKPEKEVYIFTSHREPALDGLHYLYSYDGYHWDSIAGSWLKPEIGNKTPYYNYFTKQTEEQKYAPNSMMRDPSMAAATLTGAQADAMKAAASNEAGAMTGFMGMGMAMNTGGAMNAQNLFAMGQQAQQQSFQQQQPVQPQQAAGGWRCTCGAVNNGNFCQNCGAKKPENIMP